MKTNMKLYKKIGVFFAGLFFCGFGTAICTQADLGTSPISSLPYVLTFVTHLSFGTTTFIVNMFFILAQVLLLKKDFKKIQYLQIIVTLCFGFFIDLGMYLAEPFKMNVYANQLCMLFIGSAILAFGITLEIIANVMYVPGEGVVKAISQKTQYKFGKVKVLFDASHCLLALLISLFVLHAVHGLREGTLLSMFLVGNLVIVYSKIWDKMKRKFRPQISAVSKPAH